MRYLSLFSGAGGGDLGALLLGWKCVGYVEQNEYCCRVLEQRIKDGIFEDAPIFQIDIRDWIKLGYANAYQGMVDVITAGFPCQPFSIAGKRQGDQDERNMWPATIDVIRAVRPRRILLENVPGLLAHEYIKRIFGDLAEAGFYVRWGCFSARNEGGPIERDRLFIAGADKSDGEAWMGNCSQTSISRSSGEKCPTFWLQTPSVDFGMEHGLDSYVDQVEAIGNGQVSAVVATAWRLLTQ